MEKFEAISAQFLSKRLQNLHIYIVARTRRQRGQKDTSMFSFPIGSENMRYVVRPSEFIDSITTLIVKNNCLATWLSLHDPSIQLQLFRHPSSNGNDRLKQQRSYLPCSCVSSCYQCNESDRRLGRLQYLGS